MAPAARIIGGASIVLVPLLFVVGDEIRMAIEPAMTGTLVDTGSGAETVLADLAAIEAHRGAFLLVAALSYLGALLHVPLLVVVWRMSVGRSPRWAWAGAVLAAVGVAGQMVHLTGYHGMSLAALEVEDRTAAAEFLATADGVPFVIALFVPYLLGLLAWVPQAFGLVRARVVPLWGGLAVGAGTVVLLVAGSTPWSSPVWAVLVLAGFAPAAVAVLRGVRSPAAPAGRAGRAPQPSTA